MTHRKRLGGLTPPRSPVFSVPPWFIPFFLFSATTMNSSTGPELIRKAANFGKAVVKHVADGGKHVSDEVYLARLSVCANCPSLDPERMRCLEKSCGCRLKVKARWRSESCPQGKWPSA
jgi:hypothetical protein